jgi:hypothetical protein
VLRPETAEQAAFAERADDLDEYGSLPVRDEQGRSAVKHRVGRDEYVSADVVLAESSAHLIFPRRADDARAMLNASRSLAAKTPETERQVLLNEYRELAGRAHGGTITRREECRLALVRWELDRIRDAEIGPALDFWERVAGEQLRLAKDIEAFAAEVHAAARPSRRSGR